MVSNESKLAGCHPNLLVLWTKFEALCNQEGIEVRVTEGKRTAARQAELYAQGRTKPGKKVTDAKPGQSIHEYGLAFDFAPFIDGKPVWEDNDLWARCRALAIKAGLSCPIKWDRPHCQWTGGLSLQDLRAGKRP